MNKYLFLLILGTQLFAGSELSLSQFVERSRQTNPAATYAMLDGILQHRRKNQPSVTMPIYFGVIIQPERTTGQLILNGDEGYILGQTRSLSGSTVILMPGSTNKDNLGKFGVRASDLTMSFLFLPVKGELASETLSGIVPCRVVVFDNVSEKEEIRVWISTEHAFPLKAEFYRYGESDCYRTLETGGFTKRNELYFVCKIRISGPGWKTRIDFDPDTAEVGTFNIQKPPQVMRKLPDLSKRGGTAKK